MHFSTPMLIAALAVSSTVNGFAFNSNNQKPLTFLAPSVKVTESSTALEMVRIRDLFRSKKIKPVTNADVSAQDVRSLFSLWNNALATGDSRIVAARYAKEAVLLPTVSDTPRTDYESIKDYFDNFLLKKPQGVITEGKIRVGEGWAQDAG